MTTVYKWQLYNVNTGQYEYGWSDVKPTKPFTDPSQVADPDSIVVVDTIESRTVAVQQPFKGTGGYFLCEGKTLSAPANQTSTINYSYPIPIVALNIKFETADAQENDVLEAYTDDPVVGVLTNNVSVGATVIPVSPTVMTNVFLGGHIILTDGVHTDNLGRILGINTTNSTLTMETPTTHAFSASSPTYVKYRIYFIRSYTFGPAGHHDIGGCVVGGAAIPANVQMRLAYTNTSNVDRVFKIYLEYLY